IVKMAIADKHQRQYDRQMGDDGRDPAGGGVRRIGEHEEQRIARPALLENCLHFGGLIDGGLLDGSRPRLAHGGGGGGARAGWEAVSGRLVMTFDIRNTSIAAQANVKPPAERFGSKSGRRTIAGSTNSRRIKNRLTTKSQRKPRRSICCLRIAEFGGADGFS